MRNNTPANFQAFIDQWDVFYNKSFPLVQKFCLEEFEDPDTALQLIERSFLKLSFEYHNLLEEEFNYIAKRLFNIILEFHDCLPTIENTHNNALILLSKYYCAN